MSCRYSHGFALVCNEDFQEEVSASAARWLRALEGFVTDEGER